MKVRSKRPAGKPKFTASAESRKWLAEQLAAQSDWYGRCRWCGQTLTGSLKALKAHREECPRGPKAAE